MPARNSYAAKTLKEQTRALYEGVLAASVKSPRPDVDIFTFANVGISIFYVEPDEALTPAHHMNAIWLGFEVDDEPAAAVGLENLGMRPIEYFDEEHQYFQGPGGQVFRLAKR